jgi:hypothetical protein
VTAVSEGALYQAKTTFWAQVGDTPTCIRRGELVREGHEVLRQRPDAFELANQHVAHDVEQATAAPGEKRGGSRKST